MSIFFFLLFFPLSSIQAGGLVSGSIVATGDFDDREIGDGDFVDRIGDGDFDDRCGEFVGVVTMGTGATIGVVGNSTGTGT